MNTRECYPWHCRACDVGGYTRAGWDTHLRVAHPAGPACAECGAPLDAHWRLRTGRLIHPPPARARIGDARC